MKTLLLMRHAKSSWKDEALDDHDRPLNRRGKHDAPLMGRFLKEQGIEPGLILSSTARRARKTAEKVAEECGYHRGIELRPELYLAAPRAYVETLSEAYGDPRVLLVIGHNPGAEELILLLTGESVPFPTAAIAHLQLQLDSWAELQSSTPATLVDLWLPRELFY